MSALVFKVGGEQRVNLTAQGEQRLSKSTPLPEGGWIVTWMSYASDDSTHIYMQRYDGNGQAIYAADQRVDTSVSLGNERPSITALADGGWVVTWEAYNSNSSNYDIFQRHYDAAGNPKGAEFVVGETADDQYDANVVALADGGWLVTWSSWQQDGSEWGIYQQRFNSVGEAQFAPSRQVNTYVDGRQDAPTTTVLKDGGWVTTWRSYVQDGSGYGVYQQRFNADGTAQDSETRVNIETTSNQMNPKIAALDDGGWVVVWDSFNQDGSGGGIYQQRYDKAGTPLYSTDQRVNITTLNDQQDAVVTALKDGGWLITWSSENESGLTDIYQQRYDRNGQPHYTADQLVNTTLADAQETPFVTGLSDGDWVVTWTSYGQDGSGDGVYQQRFELNAAPEDIGLSGSAVHETSAAGAVIGALSVADRHAAWGDTFIYSIVDDAGGRFAVQNGQLVVANGTLLDYEQAQAHQVTVRVTDSGGLTRTETFTIQVQDVLNAVAGATKGKNTLRGTAGDDKLSGGYGNDKLTGGAGQDLFVFNAKLGTAKTDRKVNFDTLTDFAVADDTLWLDNKIFKKLGKGSEAAPGALKKAFFKIGSKAGDTNDYLIYNRKTGVLSYDADGKGAKSAVEFAKLAKNLKLTHDDFRII